MAYEEEADFVVDGAVDKLAAELAAAVEAHVNDENAKYTDVIYDGFYDPEMDAIEEASKKGKMEISLVLSTEQAREFAAIVDQLKLDPANANPDRYHEVYKEAWQEFACKIFVENAPSSADDGAEENTWDAAAIQNLFENVVFTYEIENTPDFPEGPDF